MLKFDWNMLWTIVNLIIFVVLMKIFLVKPIKNTLDKRKELIDKQFSDAMQTQEEAENLKAEYEAELADVENEKKQILVDARSSAKAEYNKIVDKAQNEADKIKSDARKVADMESEKARLAVKEDIAALAMETAAKVIGSQSSAEIDSKLYDEFLNESSDK
jgi:F-type H+-transporting ATPase subunit b